MFDRLRMDVRYGLRQLARAPLFTLVAAFSLSVGIAVVVVTFSIINAKFFRPLQLPDADRIHHVYATQARSDRWLLPAYEDYLEFARSGAFETLAASSERRLVVAAADEPQLNRVTFVSPGYFSALGIPMVRGRAPGGRNEHEIVITDDTWRWKFDNDPNVLGRTLRIGGTPVTIVGVAQARLDGVLDGAGIGWVAAELMPLLAADSNALQVASMAPGLMAISLTPGFTITGRLRSGQTPQAAAAQLTAIARALQQQRDAREAVPTDILVLTHRESLYPPSERAALALVLGAVTALVALVLTLACINVAGMQLARAVARRHEIAVRLTLGASRSRLLAQMLTESVLLALIGGTAGLMVVVWGLTLAGTKVQIPDLQPDWRVIVVAAATSLLSALVFGLAPARQALRTSTLATLQDAGTGREKNRLRGAVIAVQVAVSCVLLALALTGTRGLKLHARDAAARTDVDGLIVAPVSTFQFGNDTSATRLFVRRIQEIAAATAGVEASTTALHVPFASSSGSAVMWRSNGEQHNVAMNEVGREFFDLLGIRLVAGRGFLPADNTTATPVAIVNETFARRFGRERIARIRGVRDVEIVGVVEDIDGQHGAAAEPAVHLFMSDSRPVPFATLIARVRPGSEADISNTLAQAFKREFPDRVVPTPRSLAGTIANRGAEQRSTSRVAFWIGAIELLLAGVGLYGLLLYALAARTREVGIRLALGAAPREASWAVIRDGLRYAFVGAGAGIVIGIPVTVIAAREMLGARASDPLPLLTALACVMAAAGLAAFVPAWNASRVQPADALRHD